MRVTDADRKFAAEFLRSNKLGRIAERLHATADDIRSHQERNIAAGFKTTWDAEALAQYRCAVAAASYFDFLVADTADSAARSRAAPDWMVAAAREIFGAWKSADPTVKALAVAREVDDAA